MSALEEIHPPPRHLLPADTSQGSQWGSAAEQRDPMRLVRPSADGPDAAAEGDRHPPAADIDPDLFLPLVDVMLTAAHEQAAAAVARAVADAQETIRAAVRHANALLDAAGLPTADAAGPAAGLDLTGALRPPRRALEIWHEVSSEAALATGDRARRRPRPPLEAVDAERSGSSDLDGAEEGASGSQLSGDAFDAFWSTVSTELPARQRLRQWVLRQHA